MRIEKLRSTILETRNLEGVNWYLTDRTPDINSPGQVFSLYCYDSQNVLQLEIPHIEERRDGHIFPNLIMKIEEARSRCGINQAFANGRVLKRQPPRVQAFEKYRQIWLADPKFAVD